MINFIEETLKPLREPFVITEDGSSQTKLSNHGRFGFYVERVFGLLPNNDRRPDFVQSELKTMQEGKKISIGTMPESEFFAIKSAAAHHFELSDPYKKMKNTIVVVYKKYGVGDPVYQMTGWGLLNLETMSPGTKTMLQDDYECICKYIAKNCNSRDQVTNFLIRNGSISGNYLTLGYKGQGVGGYNYPAWGFQASFMKKLVHA
jgi:hypothetical protein